EAAAEWPVAGWEWARCSRWRQAHGRAARQDRARRMQSCKNESLLRRGTRKARSPGRVTAFHAQLEQTEIDVDEDPEDSSCSERRASRVGADVGLQPGKVKLPMTAPWISSPGARGRSFCHDTGAKTVYRGRRGEP